MKTVRSRSTGGSTAVDMVVTVDARISAAEAHAITETIEEALRARLSIDDVTIHVEPDG